MSIWIDGDEPSERSTPEKRLWGAVLLRAIEDAAGRGPGLTQLDIDQARRWIDVRNADFRMVCWLSGVEPEFAVRALAKADEPARRLAKAA
jgi:hypothetical protein